jgi:hypothetical protein
LNPCLSLGIMKRIILLLYPANHIFLNVERRLIF